jgi:phosphonate transport system ATP-binding protein
LKQASRELGITVVCNLHQIEYAREFGERIVGVSAGRIVFDGGPDELTDEVLQRIYPGLEEGQPVSASPPPTALGAPSIKKYSLEEA